MQTAPKLALDDVSTCLGGKRVLDHISLEVAPQQSLVVMGPSGAGKSVLLKHLVGLMRPDSGRLLVDGVDFWALSTHEQTLLRRRYGVAFQEGALFDSMTVFENVAFPLRRHTRLTFDQMRERVAACLGLVRLTGIEEKRPAHLSTGMRRRVGFARAVVLDPEVLLFDEPTAGLDPVMVSVVNLVITELVKRLRATAVMVTHDLKSARAVGDRIALLFEGRIVADAPAAQFFELQQPVVRQFVEGRLDGPLSGWEQGTA